MIATATSRSLNFTTCCRPRSRARPRTRSRDQPDYALGTALSKGRARGLDQVRQAAAWSCAHHACRETSMTRPGFLDNSYVRHWLGDVEPAWTALTYESFNALQHEPLATNSSARAQAEPPRRTFGFLMQQRGRSLYQMLGAEVKAATLASSAVRGEAVIEHRDDLSPEATAERLLKLGRDVDAIAVVTVDHPRITEAIERLRANRVPVVAIISDLTAPARAGYVGLDNWKVGATAGWAM